jgi:hypothetical protein
VGHAAEKKYQELTPVVHKSISIAQVRILAPAAAAPGHSTLVQKTTITVGQKMRVAALLQSLGLGKYLITFQAEEVGISAKFDKIL